MELAATLRRRGCEVTVLGMEQALLAAVSSVHLALLFMEVRVRPTIHCARCPSSEYWGPAWALF